MATGIEAIGPRKGLFSVRIKKGRYQHNGISGDGFFQVLLSDGKIATFEAEDEPFDHVKVSSTRVVDPADFEEAWRGDQYGNAIDDALNGLKAKYGVTSIYEALGRLSK